MGLMSESESEGLAIIVRACDSTDSGSATLRPTSGLTPATAGMPLNQIDGVMSPKRISRLRVVLEFALFVNS